MPINVIRVGEGRKRWLRSLLTFRGVVLTGLLHLEHFVEGGAEHVTLQYGPPARV
jgi:hypothetical protein